MEGSGPTWGIRELGDRQWLETEGNQVGVCDARGTGAVRGGPAGRRRAPARWVKGRVGVPGVGGRSEKVAEMFRGGKWHAASVGVLEREFS